MAALVNGRRSAADEDRGRRNAGDGTGQGTRRQAEAQGKHGQASPCAFDHISGQAGLLGCLAHGLGQGVAALMLLLAASPAR